MELQIQHLTLLLLLQLMNHIYEVAMLTQVQHHLLQICLICSLKTHMISTQDEMFPLKKDTSNSREDHEELIIYVTIPKD
jgi:hypothetical protein